MGLDRDFTKELIMKKLKVFEGFAGYGGASFALKRMKESDSDFDYDIVGYSEIDLHASELYDANHKDSKGKSIKNFENKKLFRKGEIGDWVNHLSPQMVEKMSRVTEEKLGGSGLKFRVFPRSLEDN